MPNRVLALELDDETFARLAAEAEAAGLSVDAHVLSLLDAHATPRGVQETAPAFEAGSDWAEADRRLAEYDRTGECIDAKTALDAFVADVTERASRRG